MIESSSGGESDINTEVAGDEDHRFAMEHLSSYVKEENTIQWLQNDLEEEGDGVNNKMGESVKDDRISGLTKGLQSCDQWRTREN